MYDGLICTIYIKLGKSKAIKPHIRHLQNWESAMLQKAILMLAAVMGLATCQPKGDNQTPPATDNPVGQEHYFTLGTTLLRFQPTDSDFVEHPIEGVPMHNSVGSLARGEQVTVIQETQGWNRIKNVGDGAEGWVKASEILPAKSVATEATVIETCTLFSTESVAAAAVGHAEPGSIVLILAPGREMTQVNIENLGSAYIFTTNLVTDANEIKAAHLLSEARRAADAHDTDETSDLLDEVRLKYPHTAFMNQFADLVEFTKTRAVPHMATYLRDAYPSLQERARVPAAAPAH